jgi:hypothetical protein
MRLLLSDARLDSDVSLEVGQTGDIGRVKRAVIAGCAGKLECKHISASSLKDFESSRACLLWYTAKAK